MDCRRVAVWIARGAIAFLTLAFLGGADWAVDPTDQVEARFGISVGLAGDTDGDGFQEVAAGAYLWDGDVRDEGRVFVFGRDALSTSARLKWNADPTDGENNQFGVTLDSGDFDCDGFSDLAVGARFRDKGELSHAGAVYVFRGGNLGLEEPASWYGQPDDLQVDANFGAALGTGDFNDDGCTDVAVGATGMSNEKVQEGRVYIYYGSAAGLGAIPSLVLDPTNDAYAWFGDAVVGLGDVNGDNIDDLAVGAVGRDRVYVFFGAKEGLNPVPEWNTMAAGATLRAAGDVNGDGFGDIVIGAPWWSGTGPDKKTIANEGRAYVYLGSKKGLGNRPDWSGDPTDQEEAQFGIVAGIGDVNRDGYDEVAVGAWLWDGEAIDEGRVYVYFGSPAGLAPDAAWILDPTDQAGALFGESFAGVDLNADGFSDLVVSAHEWNGEAEGEGRLEAYFGSEDLGKLGGGAGCAHDSHCASGSCNNQGICCEMCGPCRVCDPRGACTILADDGAACSDSNACTSGDQCTLGVCGGTLSESCVSSMGGDFAVSVPSDNGRGGDGHGRVGMEAHVPRVPVSTSLVLGAGIGAWLVLAELRSRWKLGRAGKRARRRQESQTRDTL